VGNIILSGTDCMCGLEEKKKVHHLVAGLLFLSASGSSVNCFGSGEGGLFMSALNRLMEESVF